MAKGVHGDSHTGRTRPISELFFRAALRKHPISIWAKHGVMSRSDLSIKHAADLIEYAETAARYKVLNLAVGEIGEGFLIKSTGRDLMSMVSRATV